MSTAAVPARRISLPTILAFAAGSLPLAGMGTAMSISVQPISRRTSGSA